MFKKKKKKKKRIVEVEHKTHIKVHVIESTTLPPHECTINIYKYTCPLTSQYLHRRGLINPIGVCHLSQCKDVMIMTHGVDGGGGKAMISQAERDPSIQIRLPGSSHSSPSPPPSPSLLRSSRTFAHGISWIVLSVILRRRRRILLFAPVIYISCMLFHMHKASFDAGPTIHRRPAPGSVYRSPQVYAKLRAEIDADNATADAVRLRMWAL